MSFMDYMCTRDSAINKDFRLPEMKKQKVNKVVEVEPTSDEHSMTRGERLWYWNQILSEARKVNALAKRKGVEIYFTTEEWKPACMKMRRKS